MDLISFQGDSGNPSDSRDNGQAIVGQDRVEVSTAFG